MPTPQEYAKLEIGIFDAGSTETKVVNFAMPMSQSVLTPHRARRWKVVQAWPGSIKPTQLESRRKRKQGRRSVQQ